MLKKLCVAFVGFGFCLGMMGCSDNKAQMPEKKVEKPADKPSAQTQSAEPPA